MGFKPSLLALLVAVAQGELASIRYYDLVCPSIDGKIAEIHPGHLVRYTCGTLGYNNGDRIIAARPSDCAKLCQNTTGCTGSSWLADEGKCIMSGVIHSGPRHYTIHMQNVDSVGENMFRTRGLEVDADLGPGLEVDLDLGLGQEQRINLDNSQGLGSGFGSGEEDFQQRVKEYYEEGASQRIECNDNLRTESQSPAGQFCKCQAERLTESFDFAARLNQCQQRHNQLEQDFAARLKQYQQRQIQEEQDSTKHIIACQEEHLKHQQACTERLNQHVYDAGVKTEQLEQCRKAADIGTLELSQCRDEATLKTTQLEQCHKDVDLGATQLSKCKADASLTTGQLSQCRTNAATSNTQLNNQLKQCWNTPNPCPANSTRTMQLQGRSFKMWCSRWHPMGRHNAEIYTNSFEECVGQCAGRSSCNSLVYGPSTRLCRMSAERQPSGAYPSQGASTWHGAYVI